MKFCFTRVVVLSMCLFAASCSSTSIVAPHEQFKQPEPVPLELSAIEQKIQLLISQNKSLSQSDRLEASRVTKLLFQYTKAIHTNYYDELADSLLLETILTGIRAADNPNGVNRSVIQSQILLPTALTETGYAESYAKVYFEAITRKTSNSHDHILSSAANELTSILDSQSIYLSIDNYKKLQVGSVGEFGSIGVRLVKDNEQVRIHETFPNNPAANSGILPGDTIVSIDGKSMLDKPVNIIVDAIVGKVGSKMDLVISRAGKNINFTLQRELLKHRSIYAKNIQPNILYIKIDDFQFSTEKRLIKILQNHFTDAPSSITGLILDLRSNPGGVLQTIVSVADMFLTQGRMLEVKGRARDSALYFNASPNGILENRNLAIVILIDSMSGPGVAILAEALRHHLSATIVGTPTTGVGRIQTILPFGHTALKISTAQIYFPNGEPLSDDGLQPDYCLQINGLENQLQIIKVTNSTRCTNNIIYDPDHRQQTIDYAVSLLQQKTSSQNK